MFTEEKYQGQDFIEIQLITKLETYDVMITAIEIYG